MQFYLFFAIMPDMANKTVALLLEICVLLLLFSSPCPAGDVTLKTDFARHGDRILAAVQYFIKKPYHAYANTPGATGLPTRLEFTLENEGAMPVLYPMGKPEPDTFNPKLTVNTYEGQVTLLAVLPEGSYGSLYAANISMLLCSSRRCMPVKQSLTGHVPDKIPLFADTSWKNAAVSLLEREGESSGAISLEEGKAPPPIIAPENELTPSSEPAEASGENQTGEKQLGPAEDFFEHLKPRYAAGELEIYGLGKALILGLLAGLLLNAMPCVLPVLTMKVTGLLMLGNVNKRQKIRRFREHNLCFAAGILTLFTGLAILLGAADLMWGQLYQSTAILLVMLLLVFLMGLSMLGVFTLPAFDLRIGDNTKNPRLHSYATGLVSTFLATPCSGPLLGGVLAWAFTQPMLIVLAVFWSVGLGMAMPYLFFCIWPGMIKVLPRPGNWMYVFERLLGFMLLATALYLFSILPEQKHMRILTVLLVISMGAWLWGRFCGLDAPLIRRRAGEALGVLLMCGAIFWVLRPTEPLPEWNSFSPGEFMNDVGRKNMLVEFTADWCPNCKFVEATALTPRNLREWQKKYSLDLVRVDLTLPNEYAENLLKRLGSKSIPLTAVFAKGSESERPVVLRDIYSARTLGALLHDALSVTGGNEKSGNAYF